MKPTGAISHVLWVPSCTHLLLLIAGD